MILCSIISFLHSVLETGNTCFLKSLLERFPHDYSSTSEHPGFQGWQAGQDPPPPGSGCLPVRLLGSQWAKERQVCTTHCTSLFRRQASGPVSAERNWKEKISRGEEIVRREQASWSDRRNLK